MMCPSPDTVSPSLLVRVAHSDGGAFEELHYRYVHILRNYFVRQGYRRSAEDLTQEVFARVWQHRTSFENHVADLTYLLVLARHTLSEHVRRENRKQGEAINRDCQTREATLSEPEASIFQEELTQIIQQALAQLPDEQRQAAELAYLQGLSIQEASGLLRCSRKALWDRLFRARKNLGEALRHVVSP